MELVLILGQLPVQCVREVQGDKLNMVVFFLFLVKKLLVNCVRYCTPVGARKNETCLTGHPVDKKKIELCALFTSFTKYEFCR